MTVALPPPLPPLDVPRVELPADAQAAGVRTVGAWHLHLPAKPALSDVELRGAVAGAKDVDEVVHALARAYYERGHLSAQLVYAADGDDLYIALREKPITAVHAPPVLLPYFESLVGAPTLRDSDLEPRRALANVHADRAGLETQTQLVPEGRGYELDIEQQGSRADANSLRADFWNPGNRFVGRNFLDVEGRHSNIVGDQFRLLWHSALTGLGDSSAQNYNEETLTWSRATTAGVFGLTGHFYDYETDSNVTGRLREAQLAWLYPLSGTLRSRWLLEARADYTNRMRDGDVDANGDPLGKQREEYPSLQLGTHYSHSDVWGGQPVDIDAGLTARQGLNGATAKSGAALDYLLWRPTLNLNVSLSDTWDAGFVFAGQYSDDTVPEEAQWVLGGIDNIVAYLPGIAVGDSGAYAALDLQYGGWQLAGVSLKPRAFAEYGASRYAHGDSGTVQLADVGAELKIVWRRFAASVAAAAPVQHTKISDDLRRRSEANVLFKVTASF